MIKTTERKTTLPRVGLDPIIPVIPVISTFFIPCPYTGSWWGGHISLMGAYDAATDSALILDVWKYTDPFWVEIDKVLLKIP